MSRYKVEGDRLVRNNTPPSLSAAQIAKFHAHISDLPRKVESPRVEAFRTLMSRVRGVIR